MANVPNWLIGRNGPTVMTANTTTINATTGAITDTTPYALLGAVESLEFRGLRTTENISAINRFSSHHVPVMEGYEFTVNEIRQRGQGTTLSEALWFNATSGVVKFTFTRAAESWVIYGVVTDFSTPFVRGKNVVRLTVRAVDYNRA
jgi:hypothetical protein